MQRKANRISLFRTLHPLAVVTTPIGVNVVFGAISSIGEEILKYLFTYGRNCAKNYIYTYRRSYNGKRMEGTKKTDSIGFSLHRRATLSGVSGAWLNNTN